MIAYVELKDNTLYRLEPSAFLTSDGSSFIVLNVGGIAYTDAIKFFDAGFVYNAMLLLVYGSHPLPNGKDIAQAFKVAKKLAITPQFVTISRNDFAILSYHPKLTYKEIQALKNRTDLYVMDVYCEEQLDESIVGLNGRDVLDRDGILATSL